MFENVNDYLKKLEQMVPNYNKNFENQRKLEKIYLNVPANFGRYQVFPIPSVVTGFPYFDLPKTREIKMPRKNIKNDGTETTYEAWIKILPPSAYVMKSDNNGIVSSLTSAEESLLRQAASLHEELCELLDYKNKLMDPTVKELLRIKNYTVFYAHCINKWSIDNARQAVKQYFSALFVVTSKKFSEAVFNDMMNVPNLFPDAGDTWTSKVYNNLTTGREGFLMFSVQNNATGQPGFNFTVNHSIQAPAAIKSIVIDEEDMKLMSDPVEGFLGWQAARSDESVGNRRLFNNKLMKEAIDYMTRQITAIKFAKESGTSIDEAIKITNTEVLKTQAPTNTQGQPTNDPILAKMSENTNNNSNNIGMDSAERLANNTDPFTSPAAAHIDPFGGMQGGSNSSPFTAPSFANPGFGGNGNNNGAPF